ncbi:MAG: Tol-Pal system beta propeller repeat protein TolB [Deferrisomatales bacterium]
MAAPAGAKVYLDITAPTLRRIPLAVPPLRAGAGQVHTAHVEIAEVLRADLGFAGLFEVLDPRSYLEDPQTAPVRSDAASLADWRLVVGAEALVKGRVARQGDELSVDLWLYDVAQGQPVLGRHYTAAPQATAAVAHLFANAVLEELTGTPGPFGTRIAYVVDKGQIKELAAADMDGRRAEPLTRNRSLSLNPAWSRDGRYLYFTSYLLGEPDLYLLDLSTRKQWIVSREPGIDLAGRDSPDGTEVLAVLSVDGNPEIYRIDKKSRRRVRLTHSPAIDVAPTWSPDGKHIAFVSDRRGNPHLFVMDRDGGGVRRITFSGAHNGDPEWSPTGTLIAFSGQDERGGFQVYTVAPSGGKIVQRTFGTWDTWDPSWSPDGRFLAVTSNRGGSDAVYVLRLGSQEFRRVTPPGQRASQPAWSPLFLRP